MTATTGAWVRQRSTFRDWPESDEPGRYHLHVALACPWSHRAVIVRKLKGLEGAISMSCADPYRDERGWRFGDWFLAEAYERTEPGYEGRISVPVLWDRRSERIVNNESADVVRILNGHFDAVAERPGLDLAPDALRDEIGELNAWIYADVNNAVYECGFADSQEAYDDAFDRLFTALARLDDLLGERRFLCGDTLTEADWRLFVTLVRFDAVYHTHFRCNGRRLVDHANLWPYARELFQQPGIADTVAWDEIRRHYYTTHDSLNPKRLIPRGPLGMDWSAPALR